MDEKFPALDYAKPKEKLPTALDDFLTGTFVGRLQSKWFYRQLAYYLLLALLFSAIAFAWGPNIIQFGKLTQPTPADFKEHVENYCVPVVRAMKEFERDNGRLPNDAHELVPKYLAQVGMNDVFQGTYNHRGKWVELIVYDFRLETEGWYWRRREVYRRIPVPPVKLGPSTRATTQKN